MKRVLLMAAVPVFLLLPVLARADVTVHQDSCVTVGNDIRAYFSVTGPSGGDFAICSMEFIPKPQPPSAICTSSDCGAVPDWVCWLNGLGGAGYANPPYNNPFGCISGGPRGGFYLTIGPGRCCYNVRFLNESLTLVHEQTVCFTCGTVPAEESSWGAVKTRYEE